MGKVRRSTLIGLTLLLLSVAGCKVSCTTANISSLKFSKDKEGNTLTKEFASTDTVYARAGISNNGSTVTLKFHLVAEKVEGTPENTPLPNADVSVDVPGDGYGTYTLQRDGGWPAGRYRVEVAMLYNGEQKDKKADTFTVSGGGSPHPAPPTAKSPSADTPAEDDADDSGNSNSPGEHDH